MNEITAITEKYSREERRLLIIDLLRQQRTKYKGKRHDYNREMCTLIDLENGLIVGSGICPECSGWLGRTEFYEE